MKRRIPVAGALALVLGFSAHALAQTSQAPRDPSFTHGESKRCESLSGEAKAQCDREEATKSQEPASADDAKGSSEAPASAGGSSSDSSDSDSSAKDLERQSE